MSTITLCLVSGPKAYERVADVVEKLLDETGARLFMGSAELDIQYDTTPVVVEEDREEKSTYKMFVGFLSICRKRGCDLYIVVSKDVGLRLDKRVMVQVDSMVEYNYNQRGTLSIDRRSSVRSSLEEE